jgi:DNA replication protein DnaC
VTCTYAFAEANIERWTGERKALVKKYLDNPARLKNLALYSEYAEDALKSSGEWLLSEAKFQDWVKQKSSLLWIAGGLGTGKSYLSAITISKLNENYPQDLTCPSGFLVGYFYVKEHD